MILAEQRNRALGKDCRVKTWSICNGELMHPKYRSGRLPTVPNSARRIQHIDVPSGAGSDGEQLLERYSKIVSLVPVMVDPRVLG